MNADNPKALAAQSWLGYGNWDAPYWFVGMEPGGTDDDASYETWAQLGGTELIDCREHHLASNCTKWHCGDRPPTQSTWRRLIQLVLSNEGKPYNIDAVRAYQRWKWGALKGDIASVWVSALHARNLATEVSRGLHREQRVTTIRERLTKYHPKFVVFYGRTYADIYESIAGHVFENGYAWHDATLCVLVPHPTAGRPPRPDTWWVERGQEIRTVLESGSLPARAQNRDDEPGTGDYRPEDVIRLLVDRNPKQDKSKSRR